MISLLYPFLLSMKELLPTICEKIEKKKFNKIFHKGGPLWFFQFFDEVVNEKPSKMTFLKKKFQGSLQIGITFDLFFVKLKSGQKNSDQIFKYFFSNSNFLGLKKYPPKSKIPKKNSVEHLKMYLRCYTEKMG